MIPALIAAGATIASTIASSAMQQKQLEEQKKAREQQEKQFQAQQKNLEDAQKKQDKDNKDAASTSNIMGEENSLQSPQESGGTSLSGGLGSQPLQMERV